MINYLSQDDIQQFIIEHQNDDPSTLLLSGEAKKWQHFDKIVEQIKGRQKAKNKLKEWLNAKGILFPPSVSVEQASSELTALRKASIIDNGHQMIDLTGGFGLDCFYLSKKFNKATYVEQASWLCDLAKHNFKRLYADINVIHGDAQDIAQTMSPVDLIYLDPARRDDNHKKVFKLSDCVPDVVDMQELLLKKGKQVLIKLSPLIDIKATLKEVKAVKGVYIIAVKNEVKELLVLMEQGHAGLSKVCCVNLDQEGEDEFIFDLESEKEMNLPFSKVKRYLYEPNAAILKGGAFKSVGAAYQLMKLHPNTHLYTSSELKPDFPGRIFDVIQPLPFDKKKLKKLFPEMKGNITVRNFPMSVAALRKKTAIEEGGEHYIFACTGQEGKRLLLTEKIKQNSHDEWG